MRNQMRATVAGPAYADANQLSTLYEGTATLGVAKDFRAFMRRLWGMGGVQ